MYYGSPEKRAVVVFSGSSCADSDIMKLAEQLGAALAQENYLVVNGGGPGLMDLLLKGAKSVGGETFSVQLNKHRREQSPYSDHCISFSELKPRQDAMLKIADAFVALPGGIGTLYEVLEILALKNTGQLSQTPLVLLSEHYLEFIGMMDSYLASGMVPTRWKTYFSYAPGIEACLSILKDRIQLEFPPNRTLT